MRVEWGSGISPDVCLFEMRVRPEGRLTSDPFNLHFAAHADGSGELVVAICTLELEKVGVIGKYADPTKAMQFHQCSWSAQRI